MEKRGQTWTLSFLIILLAAFSFFSFRKLVKTPYLVFSDAAKFADIARQVVNHKGYTTNFTIFNPAVFFELPKGEPFKTNYFPIFPLLVSFNFLLFGVKDSVVILTSGLCFILSVALVFLLSTRYFGTRVAVLASLAYAFCPPALEYASIGASESLFILQALLAFYLVGLSKRWALFLSGIFGVLMLATRVQGPVYFLGLIIFLVLKKDRQQVLNFLIGAGFCVMIIIIIHALTGIIFFPITPFSVFFENSSLAPQNISLRGGYNQYRFNDILMNLKPLFVKTFYNLYNFYKFLPNLISPYLLVLYLISLIRWKKVEIPIRLTTLFLLIASFVVASLTIPFMRYVHPVAPLIIILGVEMLIFIIKKVVEEERTAYLFSLGFIIFFVVGPSLGQIFLDSRYLAKTVNMGKPPINYLLGRILGSQTQQADLIVTNLDTWGSWYGERKNVWLPLNPDQLIPPNGQETNIDAIFLTSYLASDPAQALGEEWQKVLDDPEHLSDPFIKSNFYLYKKFKISPSENYNRESVYGVILKKK